MLCKSVLEIGCTFRRHMDSSVCGISSERLVNVAVKLQLSL